jgi:IS30 family transposase
MYKHLSLEEREKLFSWKEQGLTLREIGRRLKRSDTTIGRELKRNKLLTRGLEKFSRKYLPCRAQQKADKRAAAQRSQASWKGPDVYVYVKEKLTEEQWSPETIAGRLSDDHPNLHICHETIYSAIYAKENRKFKLWQYLTIQRKKRMKKGGRHVHRDSRIPEAVSIDKRPKAVDRRIQLGHWETDNVIGRQTDKTALSVTVERTLRITVMSKLTAKTADEKTKRLFERMSGLPKDLRRTITADNGAENTNHKQITQSLEMLMYFCHAYHSWERGTVENTNGRIRRFIPKGMSMDEFSAKDIQAIEWKLNNTPRKCLGFKTPLEALAEVLHNTKTTNRCTSR